MAMNRVSVLLGWLSVTLLMAALASCNTPIPLPNSSTPTPDPTPTLTPAPTVAPDLAERQLLATVDRWTSTQRIGVDCVRTVCNQQVDLSITLLTPDVLADLAMIQLAGRHFAQEEFDIRLAGLRERLQAGQRLPVLFIVRPSDQRVPLRSDFLLGSMSTNMVLLAAGGIMSPPAYVDPFLDTPLPATARTVSQGYFFLDIRDAQGRPLIDLAQDTSLLLQLRLNESLRSDKEVISWSIDLIAPSRPAPVAPTQTPDPNITQVPLVDREVILKVVDLLTELAR